MAEAPSRVAVIDIGSNSIKILIAERDGNGRLAARHLRTLDARISKGISGPKPTLSEEGMNRGVEAVQSLLTDLQEHPVEEIAVVATSAVRDASNGAVFALRVLEATGHTIRILSGEEEANLIGAGLTCDPALEKLQDFYVFDLGGGSMEILAFRGRKIERAISLPLGCVRLTERFVPDATQPFSVESLAAIRQHTHEVIHASGFAFGLPPAAAGIGAGGTVTTARAIFAARAGRTLAEWDTLITVDQMRELLATTSRACLEDRVRLPGMPPKRADVFPTAVATLVATAEVAGLPSLQNSVYNLRWGLAAQMLGAR